MEPSIGMPSEESMAALVGHRFAGGTYVIEHWENFLFTEATGVDPLPDAIAHPAHLFHVAINGVGTSISEIFELAGTQDGDPVSIDFYDWRLHEPLRENVQYRLRGGVTEHQRSSGAGSRGILRDSFTYEIEIDDDNGRRVADVSFRWHHWRPTPGAA